MRGGKNNLRCFNWNLTLKSLFYMNSQTHQFTLMRISNNQSISIIFLGCFMIDALLFKCSCWLAIKIKLMSLGAVFIRRHIFKVEEVQHYVLNDFLKLKFLRYFKTKSGNEKGLSQIWCDVIYEQTFFRI